MDMSELSERLRIARERAGFADARRAIERHGWTASTYYGHENGDRAPRPDKLREYAKAFNVPYSWLSDGGPNPPDPTPIATPATNASQPAPAREFGRAGLIPVVGVAKGGADGLFEFNGQVVDRLARPPILASVMDAYAVFVSGESMEPRYFSGEAVFVHPGRPVRKGNFVVVQLHPENDGEPPLGFVKQFVAWTPSEIVLSQYNPAGEIRFDRERVLSVHRIVMAGDDA